MKKSRIKSVVAVFCAMFLSTAVNASWTLNEVYSNENGTVLFIELISGGVVNTNISGQVITATSDGNSRSFVIPNNLPPTTTSPATLLLATSNLSQIPGYVTQDFTLPSFFFDSRAVSITIDYAGTSQITFNGTDLQLDDQSTSIDAFNQAMTNSPKNYSDETGELFEDIVFFNGYEQCDVRAVAYFDADNDGFGDPNQSAPVCETTAIFVADNTDCNDTDANIRPGQVDVPDMQFIDSNCDGMDGDVTDSYFVANGGNGDGLTPLTPSGQNNINTIVVNAVNNNTNWVVFTNGNFNISGGSTLLGSVNWAGGYLNTFSQREQPSQTDFNVSFDGFVLNNAIAGLRLQNINISNTSNAPNGNSSYVMKILNAPNIILEKVAITSLNGGSGNNGADGVNGANGNSGTNGGDGVEDGGFTCDSGSRPNAGNGGNNNFCNASGGNGGRSGLDNNPGLFGQSGIGPGGNGGQPGNGSGSRPGNNASNGMNGFNGSPGPQGSGGSDFSSFIGLDYNSNITATNGLNGTSGGGGGGGGGGPSIPIACIDGSIVTLSASTLNVGSPGLGGLPNGDNGLATENYECQIIPDSLMPAKNPF